MQRLENRLVFFCSESFRKLISFLFLLGRFGAFSWMDGFQFAFQFQNLLFFFWDGVSELTGESVMWWTTLQSNTCGSYHFVSLGWQLTRIDVACSVCTFAPGYALFLCWSLAVSTELLPAVCFSIYPAKEWNDCYKRHRRACVNWSTSLKNTVSDIPVCTAQPSPDLRRVHLP